MHTTLMYDKLFKCTWTTVVSISTVVAVGEKEEKEERATDDILSSMDQRSESSHPRDVNFEFILRGRGSDISTKFSEPIIIPTNLYEGKIGLKGFVCYHSIPNVSQDVNNKILIKVPTTATTTTSNRDAGDDDDNDDVGDYCEEQVEDLNDTEGSSDDGGDDGSGDGYFIVSLDTGAYEIKTINRFIHEAISQKYPKLKGVAEDFKLLGNGATLKAEFLIKKAGYGVKFDVQNSICSLLGFNRNDVFEKRGRFVAENIVDICPVTQLIFNTNLSECNYINSHESPFIYSASLDVPPGYRMMREIDNISYKNLTTNQISFIRVWLTDQLGRPIDLRNDELLVTLSLKLERLVARVEVTSNNKQ